MVKISRRFTPRKGLILIVVLWLIAIMAIFGAGLARIAWSGYYFARTKVNKFVALQTITTIVAMFKFDRLSDETPGYDLLSEFPQDATYENGRLKVVYSITDEERKININKVASTTLKNLPDFGSSRASALTTSTYRPFDVKEEILLIDEIDEEDFNNIKDYITVHGDGRVNMNTCSEETMEILGLKSNVINTIMTFRQGQDGEPNTGDDGVFESNIIETLKENFYLTLGEEQQLVSLLSKRLTGVKSYNYCLEAKVYDGDRLTDEYTVIFGKDKGSKKYSIKRWQRK